MLCKSCVDIEDRPEAENSEQTVYLVFNTYSYYEGQPFGIFSTKEKAEQYIELIQAKGSYDLGLRVWDFQLNEDGRR